MARDSMITVREITCRFANGSRFSGRCAALSPMPTNIWLSTATSNPVTFASPEKGNRCCSISESLNCSILRPR